MERALLAGILQSDNGSFRTASQYLTADSFIHKPNQALFRMMNQLTTRGLHPDFQTIVESLEASGNLEKAGGIESLVNLMNTVPSASQVENHAKRLSELALLRQTIAACDSTIKECCSGTAAPDKVLDSLRTTAIKLSYGLAHKDSGSQIAEIVQQTMALMGDRQAQIAELRQQKLTEDEIRQRVSPGVKTGFLDLDGKISGIKIGEVMTIAAVTAGGKSAWAQCVARHVAVEQQQPVIYFTLEMSRHEVANRMLTIGTARNFGRQMEGVAVAQMDFPLLSPEQEAWLQESRQALAGSPMVIVDDCNTLEAIIHRTQREMLGHPIRPLVIIDHLHLLELATRPGRSDAVQMEEMANKVKRDLATALAVPVIQLAQFNQDVYTSAIKARVGKAPPRTEPQLRHLYGGSGIQKASSTILFIHYPDGYWPDQPGWDEYPMVPCEFILKKNRSAGLGRGNYRFFKHSTKFVPSDRKFTPPAKIVKQPEQGAGAPMDADWDSENG